jgi:hypothetical protein
MKGWQILAGFAGVAGLAALISKDENKAAELKYKPRALPTDPRPFADLPIGTIVVLKGGLVRKIKNSMAPHSPQNSGDSWIYAGDVVKNGEVTGIDLLGFSESSIIKAVK